MCPFSGQMVRGKHGCVGGGLQVKSEEFLHSATTQLRRCAVRCTSNIQEVALLSEQ